MAVLETLFVFAGLLLLTIMNRPSSTGSRAKRIVSSILLAAYLVAGSAKGHAEGGTYESQNQLRYIDGRA